MFYCSQIREQLNKPVARPFWRDTKRKPSNRPGAPDPETKTMGPGGLGLRVFSVTHAHGHMKDGTARGPNFFFLSSELGQASGSDRGLHNWALKHKQIPTKLRELGCPAKLVSA